MTREERYSAFEKELTELCKKYNVSLVPNRYDILQVWNAGTRIADKEHEEYWHRWVENCLEERVDNN